MQAYERAWRGLAAAAGLPPARVLDLRGNHDAFDALRGDGASDGFLAASATAAALGAGGANARVRVTRVPPRLLVAVGPAADSAWQQQPARSIAQQADGDDDAKRCPAAALLGVDAVPDVRMHSFT